MNKKYTDDEIKEIVSKYEYLRDFRLENLKLYNALIARLGGSGRLFFSHLKRYEREIKDTPKSKRRRGRRPKDRVESLNKNGQLKPKLMFPVKMDEEGNKLCGRCWRIIVESAETKRSMCKKCSSRTYVLSTMNKDLNPWNVRDQFAYTVIRWHDKTFNIGLHCDDRLKGFLTLIGYGFIFKDIYPEVID